MSYPKKLVCLQCLVGIAVIFSVSIAAFLYSGWYPMGADTPHNQLTYRALATLRDHSIARASASIVVPADLNKPERLLAGGADYNDMCAGCHLNPAVRQTDLAQGLYPAPPDLTQPRDQDGDNEAEGRRRFWIIKHGIKASGMPAWGPGHDDERIWNMVAFLQRLPELTPEQYQILTARDNNNTMDH